MRSVRSPPPPTMTGRSPTGRGYDVVSGSETRCPAYGLVPGAQRAFIVSIALLQRVESRSRRGKPEAVCRVLAFPPARTDPDERPPTRQRRQRRRGLGRDARGAEGHRRDERPELEPRRRGGEGAERHPRLGDRVPGAADLRDLDEVVHECDAGEPGLLGGAGHVAQPGEQVTLGREARQLEHDAAQGRPVRRARRPRGGLPSRGVRSVGRRLVRGDPDDLPPLGLEQVHRGGDRGELAREDAGRDRALASGVARTAYGRRACRGRRRRPGALRPGRRPASGGGGPRRCRACRRRSSGGARRGPRRPARAARRRRPWRRGRAHRCRRPRAARPTRRPRRRGSATTPTSTCPSPRRRPARRGPGRAGTRRRVSARRLSASGGGRARRARPTPCARGAPR